MIGTSFLRVAAHDDDFGTNAAITYSMSSEQPEYLKVNPLTGWVYVNQPISQVHSFNKNKHFVDGVPFEAFQTFTDQALTFCCWQTLW